jgi:hypothetical protein
VFQKKSPDYKTYYYIVSLFIEMPRSSSTREKKIPAIPIITHKQNLVTMAPPKSSFFQTMKEGLAFGVGNSIANRIVGSFMGPSKIQSSLQSTDTNRKEYEQCIEEYDDKIICHSTHTNRKEYEQCIEEYDDKIICHELYHDVPKLG